MWTHASTFCKRGARSHNLQSFDAKGARGHGKLGLHGAIPLKFDSPTPPFNAFRLWVFGGLAWVLVSPSLSADCLQCLSALGVWGIGGSAGRGDARRDVFNAFRLWVFGGSSGATSTKRHGLQESSMPFGFGCLGDLKRHQQSV